RTGNLAQALRETGLPVDVVAREGEDPAAGIIAIAGELAADAVVVGARGRGFFDGLLGSTGTKVARRCPVPVLVLRQP
ncbi:MAG TPA: universal stress protein, partial [Acidimicrobiia bacterium]|nr:universal stress protein [Acidimicrobiia bacterium]